MASLSNDDVTTCPLCHVTLGGENELQLHYLQSCAGYDNEGNACQIFAIRMHTHTHMHTRTLQYTGAYMNCNKQLSCIIIIIIIIQLLLNCHARTYT